MPYNPYQPFPYPQQYQPQPQPQQNTYAFVNGVEGAKSYAIMPNQTVMLMDSENPIAYMKTANQIGQATIKYYKLIEIDENEARGKNTQPTAQFALKSDLEALASKVAELTKGKDNA